MLLLRYFDHFLLTWSQIFCHNYSVHPDGFGGVSVWQKFDFKRVNL